jgi:endonuclease/exonuclease/phosphatase family metal-dependent hydrolase
MRLVTWNTLWRFGDWQPRQPLLAAALADLRPEVVLLQETWPEQSEELAAACGLRVLGYSGGFFDQELSSVPDDELFGNAILGRTGEIVVDQPFASDGDPAPRRLLAATVDGMLVASVHLSHMADRGHTRADQLAEIVSVLGEVSQDFLIGGDCNLVPSSPEHEVARRLGLVDSWAALRPGDHGPTMVPDNPEIAETSWMDARNDHTVPPGTGIRLDYLWTHGRPTVRSIDRFGSVAGARWPSDHLGLVAELVPDPQGSRPAS